MNALAGIPVRALLLVACTMFGSGRIEGADPEPISRPIFAHGNDIRLTDRNLTCAAGFSGPAIVSSRPWGSQPGVWVGNGVDLSRALIHLKGTTLDIGPPADLAARPGFYAGVRKIRVVMDISRSPGGLAEGDVIRGAGKGIFHPGAPFSLTYWRGNMILWAIAPDGRESRSEVPVEWDADGNAHIDTSIELQSDLSPVDWRGMIVGGGVGIVLRSLNFYDDRNNRYFFLDFDQDGPGKDWVIWRSHHEFANVAGAAILGPPDHREPLATTHLGHRIRFENIKIRGRSGYGAGILHAGITSGRFENIETDGFAYGIAALETAHSYPIVYRDVRATNATHAGLNLGGSVVRVEGFESWQTGRNGILMRSGGRLSDIFIHEGGHTETCIEACGVSDDPYTIVICNVICNYEAFRPKRYLWIRTGWMTTSVRIEDFISDATRDGSPPILLKSNSDWVRPHQLVIGGFNWAWHDGGPLVEIDGPGFEVRAPGKVTIKFD